MGACVSKDTMKSLSLMTLYESCGISGDSSHPYMGFAWLKGQPFLRKLSLFFNIFFNILRVLYGNFEY